LAILSSLLRTNSFNRIAPISFLRGTANFEQSHETTLQVETPRNSPSLLSHNNLIGIRTQVLLQRNKARLIPSD
jgi:hypothetical protein